MSKSKKSNSGHGVKPDTRNKGCYGVKERNLMGVNPTKEQFEPTDSSPIRQRNKMGGGS